MKKVLDLIASKGLVTESYEERNSLLCTLGYNYLKTIYNLDNHIAMLYKNNVLCYPWDLRVLYVDPFSRICKAEIYFHPLDVALEYWLDIDTIVEAGLEPVVNRTNGYAQSMVWMCEEHATIVRESMLIPPIVIDKRERYVELETHINYFFEVIFGVRGYVDEKGELHYVATSHQIANVWRDVIIKEASLKLEKVLSATRWYNYIDRIDKLNELNIHTKPTEVASKEKDVLIQKLMLRL